MTDKISTKRLYLFEKSVQSFKSVFRQRLNMHARLVLTVEIDQVIIAATNLKVVPAIEKYLLLGDNSFSAAEKISDLILKDIHVIPCQEYNI